VSMDVRRQRGNGYEIFTRSGRQPTGLNPLDHAMTAERLGAGELLVNSVDRDGSMAGYDLELIRLIADGVGIPVIAAGGAGSLPDLAAAITRGGASAVAAGSLFVFQGRHRSVMISYPEPNQIDELIKND